MNSWNATSVFSVSELDRSLYERLSRMAFARPLDTMNELVRPLKNQ